MKGLSGADKRDLEPRGFRQKADRVVLSEELALGSEYLAWGRAESPGVLPGAYMGVVTVLADHSVAADAHTASASKSQTKQPCVVWSRKMELASQALGSGLKPALLGHLSCQGEP